jgi:hypothetical protein
MAKAMPMGNIETRLRKCRASERVSSERPYSDLPQQKGGGFLNPDGGKKTTALCGQQVSPQSSLSLTQ